MICKRCGRVDIDEESKKVICDSCKKEISKSKTPKKRKNALFKNGGKYYAS